ncbi:HTTM domain-containing protein [Halorubrum sp. CSM-61]|uniref:HTTM domain-containing protein n=1 Tax=Halorubrum sp. CSM-61 TaxID=2485838 RepID=UPI000F4BA0C5|nr:HTTM domain-containing protein [Halorubrum sp. CSM-61]
MTERRDAASDDTGSEVGAPGSPVSARLRAALRRRIGIDVRALAAFRIALGAVLLADLALRARNLTAFYTDSGVLPRSAVPEPYALGTRLSLHALSGEAWVVGPLFIVAGLAAIALAVGYRTRLAAAVSLVLLASLQARNPFVLNAGDTLLWQLLGAGLLCPIGARWSVDAVRRRGQGAAPGAHPPTERARFAGPASALLLAVVIAVYVSNAVVKLRGEAWPAGEAVETVFRLTYLHGPLGGLVPENAALLAAAAYGWLGLLVASPLLVASAGRVRAALAGVLVAAHLSMTLTLQIGVFSVASATALLPFFPPFVWDRIESLAAPATERFRSAVEVRSAAEGLPAPPRSGSSFGDSLSDIVPAGATRGRALAAVAAVLLVSALAWNAVGLGVVAAPDPVAAVSDPGDSDWDMFAPSPPSTDSLVLATATTADGDRIDALYGDPVAADRPLADARGYPTARWRKHFSLLPPDDPDRVDATLAYLCDRAAGLSGAEIESVTVSSVEVDVSGSDEVRVREIGTRECR